MNTTPTSNVVYLKNALTPQCTYAAASEGKSLSTLAPAWDTPFVAFVNGAPILRKHWHQVPAANDYVYFVDARAIPMGGGGGGSNPVRMLLAVALVASGQAWAEGLIKGAEAGSFLSSGFGGALVRAGVGMVTGMLASAVLGRPQQPSTHTQAAAAAPSPTYSLQAQGNTARLGAAIPEHFGRLTAYPDFAAQPYSEFFGNEQFLYQLLCLGRGEYDIESIRIEDTNISNFEEITYEVVPPGETLDLFPANVETSIEVSGQDLVCRDKTSPSGTEVDATYAQSGTTITVQLSAHGLTVGKQVYLNFTTGTATSGTYSVNANPGTDSFTVTAASSATTSGTLSVAPWVGPFVANEVDSEAAYLGLDYVMPRGLYQLNTGTGALETLEVVVTAEYRVVGGSTWNSLGVSSYSGSTTTPQRNSTRASVPLGRYEVRARRVNPEKTSSSVGHSVIWAGLRAYLKDTRIYGDVTLIAMRMRASNNLSLQASRKINVIATRKLPVWGGSSWTTQPTRSIAWALAYTAKQVGLSDTQIDISALTNLDTTWTARGDTFDGRFDNTLSAWEALTRIAHAGRAKPFMQAGVLRVVRDQAVTIPVAMYSTRNIVKRSFSIEYTMPSTDTADAVDVQYFDATTSKPARVRAVLSGGSQTKPVKVDLFGVTSRDQAYREGLYHAASNKYRRKIIKFATEMEGFIPSYGDLIAVQHDMPGWGQSGSVTAWDSVTKTATLSETVEFGVGTHYIAFRAKNGSVVGPFTVVAGTGNNVVVTEPITFTPYTGGAYERTHYMFGSATTYRQRARVLSITPKGATQVEITAVNESDNVHTAETGMTTPEGSSSTLANYTNAPSILGLEAMSMPDNPDKMVLSWAPSPWADYYLIEQSADGVLWTRSGEPSTSNFTTTALYGSATILRVAAVGIARGPWHQISYGNVADYMWNANDTTLMWNANDTTLMWSY